MKTILRFLAYLIGAILLVVAAAALWVQFSGLPTYTVETVHVSPARDSATLATGRKIVENVCAYCHRSDDGILSGRIFSKGEGFGTLWSGNITSHPTAGIGRYSEDELATLIRTGVKRDGHYCGPFMSFPNLSDADLSGIVTYLRSGASSLTPSDVVHVQDLSFLAKALYKFGIFKPEPTLPALKPLPPDTALVDFGRYLVTGRYECYGCHSASYETLTPMDPESSPGYLAGGNPVNDRQFNRVVSRNITPHLEQGIGAWTEEQFFLATRAGIRPDGRLLSEVMPRLAPLDSIELHAIWTYLRTVPARETNPVNTGH